VPLWGGGAGSPSNRMWPVPSPTCMPSFVLIRPNSLATVHERHIQTDRTDRQDRQRTDSIGRTVLQTVTQKSEASVRLSLLHSQRALTLYPCSDRLRCCDRYVRCQQSLAVKPLNSRPAMSGSPSQRRSVRRVSRYYFTHVR